MPKMDNVFNENACYNDYFVTAYYTTSHQPPHAWQQQQRQRRNLHTVLVTPPTIPAGMTGFCRNPLESTRMRLESARMQINSTGMQPESTGMNYLI